MLWRGWYPMVELEHTHSLLSKLGLDTASELLDAKLEDAMHKDATYLSFLSELLGAEMQEKKRRSEETRIKLSRLPHRKTLEEFDFGFQPSIDTRQIKELSTLAFVARDENVIFSTRCQMVFPLFQPFGSCTLNSRCCDNTINRCIRKRTEKEYPYNNNRYEFFMTFLRHMYHPYDL
jgi:hypothetical protein